MKYDHSNGSPSPAKAELNCTTVMALQGMIQEVDIVSSSVDAFLLFWTV